jgi:cytochrome c553
VARTLLSRPSRRNTKEQRISWIAKALATRLTLILGLIALSVQTAVGINLNGQEIAHQGNSDGAPACTTCHGGQFQGDAGLKAPALAGLPRAFILSRFAHYAGPDGHNASMRQVATALSLGEREAVAAYLSSLPTAREQVHP